MQQHLTIHQSIHLPLKILLNGPLFNETVDELFEGENAELIKQSAKSISTVMQIKMFK